ncbi:aminotransferase class I/II-fold pyridoxal phosphate-dependent enzyme [Nocardia sp. CDC160]|uniref:aminotransferase class I/II-fold pyridoxal phosphate-dependent enzyme n=1 Tax=Nocardia sp. CDC160 TaxID=3112166 RepID=UPI002DBFB6E6|nr:aminotransferase class I/II-fold pyridoxal phosphate-dependent enzyme [Nocardia sp. CDC160]MEC3919975.1 aminotransferase class I/II-fold pyridoxal phosphate-dependent enzyme [Nocardia sp. CDC160]
MIVNEYRAEEESTYSTVTLDLSNNALPFAPLPSVRKAIEAEVDRAADYPSAAYGSLRAAIADFVGCGPEQVIVGPGSVGVLGYVLRRVAGHGGRVVFAVPAFDAYERVVVDAGGTPVPVWGRGIRWQSPEALVSAAGDDAAAILICAPHNPTGERVGPDEIERVLAAVPSHTVVVVDEAYIDFDRTGDPAASFRLARSHPNLIVMRTFSKAYGLAGLRVGYAIGDGELIGACRTAAMPFGVNRLAVAAAIASLEVGDELAGQVDQVVRCRSQLAESVRAQGFTVPESYGNFLWLPTRDPAELVDRFSRNGIAVRAYRGLGVRITVPAPQHLDDVLAALAEGYSRMEASACHR